MVDLPDGPDDLHAGIYGVRPMEMSLPGGALVPIAGLTWVGVHPDARRRGVLSAMMTDHLTRTHDAGTAISALHASEAAIYGRFGYGIAVLTHQVDLGRGTTFTAPHLEDEVAGITTHLVDHVAPGRGRADARVPARPGGRLPRHDRRLADFFSLLSLETAGAAARQGAPPHPLRAPRRRGRRLRRACAASTSGATRARPAPSPSAPSAAAPPPAWPSPGASSTST